MVFAEAVPFLGGIGAPELIIIAVILVILFGPGVLGAIVALVAVVRTLRARGDAPAPAASATLDELEIGMLEPLDRQAIVDEEHLRLLPVCYWVSGAVTAFMALYGLFYLGMGLLFAFAPGFASAEDGTAFIGWVFGIMGAAFTIGGGSVATLQILTGFWIRARRHRTACLVIAGITCAFVPFGTLFGVFTFMTLLRPSVAAMFAGGKGAVDALA